MDDGSIDDTAAVVAAFNDPRIIYEWDKNSGGPARPRNRGIARAQGEWICFLDADDWWTVNKLQVCSEHINDNVDFIYHDLEIFRDPPALIRRKTIKTWQVKKPVLINLLLKGNYIANSSVVVRKSMLEKIGCINESVGMIASEDYNTWLRIAQLTDRFVYLPRRLGYYLTHNQSISQKDMSISGRVSVAEFIHLLDDQQKNKLESNFRYTRGRFNYLTGNYSEVEDDLWFVMKHGYWMLRVKSSIFLFILMSKIIFNVNKL